MNLAFCAVLLVSAAELEAQLGNPSWVVFDCRHSLADPAEGVRMYSAGRIPGAFFAAVETELSGPKSAQTGRHPLPASDQFARFLSDHGVSEATTVVAYDDVGGQYAARLWWLARWLGLTQVALLDGGFPKWVADGHPVTTVAANRPNPARLRVQVDNARFVTADDIRRRLGHPEYALVDARAAERFRGEVEPLDPVAGHIPGARNRFYRTNLNADLTFRPAAELRREFESLLAGVPPSAVTHQCGSGITACVNLFAMEYAGLPGSQLYPGSWSEWVSDAARPVSRGPS